MKNRSEYRYLPFLREICVNVYPIPVETCVEFKQCKIRFFRILLEIFSVKPFFITSFRSSAMVEIINQIGVDNYDVLHIFKTLLIPNIIQILKRKSTRLYTVLDIDDIESKKVLRYIKTINVVSKDFLKYFLDYFKLLHYERNVFPLFDCCLVCSKDDNDSLIERGFSNKIEIIPNGTEIFNNERCYHRDNGKSILFLGSMDYEPNEEAVFYFVRSIFPIIKKKIENVVFIIAGKLPSYQTKNLNNDKDIYVTGHIDNVKEQFIKCTISVVPIRLGGGTRIKILEAMAVGTPVVSTSIGCEGIEVTSGKNILIADDVSHFAQSCIRLLNDEKMRNELGYNGKKLVEDRYGWNSIGKKLNKVIEHIDIKHDK
jgi:polysaccharide biosynthesis protein PslH